MNYRLPKTTVEYSSFPMNRKWKPVSESRYQFTVKVGIYKKDNMVKCTYILNILQCPLKCEVSSLLNAAPRINYIQFSQPKLNTDLLKALNKDAKESDSLAVHVPANTHKYGLNCINNLEAPNHIINTNDVGFSRLVDPYLSTTTIDYRPMQYLTYDNITFWNWDPHKHISLSKHKQSSRAALPPIKKVPYRSYSS